MYLTVFKIDMHEPSKALFCVYDQYKTHQWITGLLHQSRKDGKVLHRIMKDGDYAYLYIQTEKPFPTEAAEKDGFTLVRRTDLTTETDSLEDGSYVYVDILSVPSKRTEGKARYLKERTEINDWFVEKMQSKGMEPESCKYSISKEEDVEFYKEGKYNHLSTYAISGIIRIADKELFKQTVEKGFYRNKCWGTELVLFKALA